MIAASVGLMAGALGAVAVAWLIIGLLWRLFEGDPYDDIGRGGIEPQAARPDSAQVRDREIAELLAARAERHARRGTTPPAMALGGEDPGIAEEVRANVLAENARRERRGEEPLDVEAETARRLSR
jgi:hypothetical protein